MSLSSAPAHGLLGSFPSAASLRTLIELAKAEDLGASEPGYAGAGSDITSRLLVPPDQIAVGTLLQKSPGVAAGLPIVEMVCRAYDERIRIEQIPGFHFELIEGRYSDQKETPLLRLRGPLRSLLSAERVILNFLQRISGVATLTHRYVRRVEGTRAKVLDTRKTLPGFRALDKYAVRAGGGHNHRIGLYDGILVKDNHLAHLPLREIAPYLTRVLAQARSEAFDGLIEVEVDTLEQLAEVLKVDGGRGGVQVILLDNMDCPRMEQAVQLRNASGQPIQLEASGGVTLDTIRTIALTGVDRISVGALTHSTPALDISLDIEPE